MTKYEYPDKQKGENGDDEIALAIALVAGLVVVSAIEEVQAADAISDANNKGK